MTHDEIQNLLEGYVDETLDRPTRKTVDEHLAHCEECQAILEDVQPVDMALLGPRRYDERAMRRVVRRSIFRTAADAVMILVAGLIVVTLLAALVYQPLVINRGGRAADAARATIDLATMLNPGAVVTEGQIQSGLFDREVTAEVVLPVGADSQELGSFGIRIGAFGISDMAGGPPWPFLGPEGFDNNAEEQLSRLGSGTVATIRIDFITPISVAEAQEIADASSQDIRVVWAGFDVSSPTGDVPSLAAGPVLGYATCVGTQPFDDELLGASSAGFSQSVPGAPSSIGRALNLVRDGMAHFVSSPDLVGSLLGGRGESTSDVDQVLARLTESDAGVKMLVITGPSPEIADYLSNSTTPAHDARTLAVDFYNWTTPVCGR